MDDAAALAGLRVLDCTTGIAGAYCTQLLAMFGANVIKIEPPGQGDSARAHGPFPGDIPNAETAGLFLHLNTGKQSVALDLSTASGRVILKKLLPNIDVLVEDGRTHTASGLDHATLMAAFPHLICASVTPFGRTGPWQDYRGDAFTAWAAGGLTAMGADPDQPPAADDAVVAEYTAGLHLLTGILAALAGRARDGRGQWVETSVMEAVAILSVSGACCHPQPAGCCADAAPQSATLAALLAGACAGGRDRLVALNHPVAGTLRYPGLPWQMDATPGHLTRAPLHGEHTPALLSRPDTGYTPAEVVLLRERGII